MLALVKWGGGTGLVFLPAEPLKHKLPALPQCC